MSSGGSLADAEVMAVWTDFWLWRLVSNLAGYASLVVPVLLVVHVLRRRGLLIRADVASSNLFYRLLGVLVMGRAPDAVSEAEEGLLPTEKGGGGRRSPAAGAAGERLTLRRLLLLCGCVCGLQASYLTWGVLQEKIMTQRYERADAAPPTDADRFRDSQFLVFVNRLSAFVVSGLFVWAFADSQPLHTAPLYKYSYASFSNIMSSWCQYEALKFISFPTQVLGKASKIIPVMLMGTIVSRRSYPAHQYATALLISAGVSLFLLSRGAADGSAGSGKSAAGATTVSGVVLMVGYLAFDSFTANWQGALFAQYRVSSLQMMCGVNLFSSVFTLVSLVEQGGLVHSTLFALSHAHFLNDAALLSLCSAVGQLFIFFTISRFGPVAFTIAMTVRQGLAVLLSCLIYGHRLGVGGVVGAALVFGALLLRAALQRASPPPPPATPPPARPVSEL